MISKFDQARGAKNWVSNAAYGLKAKLNEIIDTLNTLVVGSVAAETFFSANVQSSAADITLAGTANIQSLTFTTTGKFVLLGPTSDATVFDGCRVLVHNAGSNDFGVKDSAGSILVSAVSPGEVVELFCTADGTASGTWKVNYLSAQNTSNLLLAQLLN